MDAPDIKCDDHNFERFGQKVLLSPPQTMPKLAEGLHVPNFPTTMIGDSCRNSSDETAWLNFKLEWYEYNHSFSGRGVSLWRKQHVPFRLIGSYDLSSKTANFSKYHDNFLDGNGVSTPAPPKHYPDVHLVMDNDKIVGMRSNTYSLDLRVP